MLPASALKLVVAVPCFISGAASLYKACNEPAISRKQLNHAEQLLPPMATESVKTESATDNLPAAQMADDMHLDSEQQPTGAPHVPQLNEHDRCVAEDATNPVKDPNKSQFCQSTDLRWAVLGLVVGFMSPLTGTGGVSLPSWFTAALSALLCTYLLLIPTPAYLYPNPV